jgi:hypothetical protein
MKDTDAHGALIYQRIFEMFSLKIRVHYLCALANGSAAMDMALALVYKAAQAVLVTQGPSAPAIRSCNLHGVTRKAATEELQQTVTQGTYEMGRWN